MSRTIETILVASLDPGREPNLAQTLADTNVVVADIDYTLIDIDPGHQLGVRNIAQTLGEDIAQTFDQIFHLVLEGHRQPIDQQWSERRKFDATMQRLQALEHEIIPTYGVKVWSKAVFLAIAAERLDRSLTPDEILKAQDSYWQGRRDGSTIYPDVHPFVDALGKRNVPLVLMTASYCLTQVASDGTFSYDPDVSRKYKGDHLHTALPFAFHGLVIGDPYDKPDSRFFDKVFGTVERIAGPFASHPERILVVGDSERNDLESPRQHGCRTILVKRTPTTPQPVQFRLSCFSKPPQPYPRNPIFPTLNNARRTLPLHPDTSPAQ